MDWHDAPLPTSNVWTPTRLELLEWFRCSAPSLAPAYEGAVSLIEDKNFPGRVHFISHAVRDIAERLAFAIDPQPKGSRVEYVYEMNNIMKNWPVMDPIKDSDSSPNSGELFTIPIQVARDIDRLVKEHRDSRERPTSYEILFRHLMRNEPLQARLNENLVKTFKKTRDWFMGRAHLTEIQPRQVDEAELQSQFRKFEGMLHSFVGGFFTGTKKLDEILQKANETTG